MKEIIDFRIIENLHLSADSVLLKLTPADGSSLPICVPGQFVEVQVPESAGVLLRRPISINFVDEQINQLWLLVRNAGKGTSALCKMKSGELLNIVLPLGNGFTMPGEDTRRVLLVGGGVGVAPLLLLGRQLLGRGIKPDFLLGARNEKDLLELDLFEQIGNVFITTDDGSKGVHGVVTDHDIWTSSFDMIYCCGPMPMMKAVASAARKKNTACEVSLENMMACGLGACLCCVEPTVKGNVCVCTEGPVFNIDKLLW